MLKGIVMIMASNFFRLHLTGIFKMKLSFQIIILVTLFAGAAHAQQIPAQTLPDFEFSRMDKTRFTNKDLKKDKMIFFVFFDPVCEHCLRAIKSIDEQFKSFQNLSVYLISVDDKVKVNHFVNTYAPHLKAQKNVTLLQDNLSQFISKFKPYKYPAMFLYSTDKKLVVYEDNEETVFRFVNTIKKQTK